MKIIKTKVMKKSAVATSAALLSACSLMYQEEPTPAALLAGVEAGVEVAGVEVAGVEVAGVEAGVEVAGIEEGGVEAGMSVLAPIVEAERCVEDAEWTPEGFDLPEPVISPRQLLCENGACATVNFSPSTEYQAQLADFEGALTGERLPTITSMLLEASAALSSELREDERFVLPFQATDARCSNPDSINALDARDPSGLCVLDGAAEGFLTDDAFGIYIGNPYPNPTNPLNVNIDDRKGFPPNPESNQFELAIQRSIIRINRTVPLSAEDKYVTFNLSRSVLISNTSLEVHDNSEVNISDSVVYVTNPEEPVISLKGGRVTLDNVVFVTAGGAIRVEGGTLEGVELNVLPQRDNSGALVSATARAPMLLMPTGSTGTVALEGVYLATGLVSTALRQQSGQLSVKGVIANNILRFLDVTSSPTSFTSVSNAFIKARVAIRKDGGGFLTHSDLCAEGGLQQLNSPADSEFNSLHIGTYEGELPDELQELAEGHVHVTSDSSLTIKNISAKNITMSTIGGSLNLSGLRSEDISVELSSGSVFNLIDAFNMNASLPFIKNKGSKVNIARLLWQGRGLLEQQLPEESAGVGEITICDTTLKQLGRPPMETGLYKPVFGMGTGKLTLKNISAEVKEMFLYGEGDTDLTGSRLKVIGTAPTSPINMEGIPLSLVLSRGAKLTLSDSTFAGSNVHDSLISTSRATHATLTRLNLLNAVNVGLTRLARLGLGVEMGTPSAPFNLNSVYIQTNDLTPNLDLHPISLLLFGGVLEQSEGLFNGESVYTNAPIIINSTGVEREVGEELFASWADMFTCHGDVYLLDCEADERPAYDQICADF